MRLIDADELIVEFERKGIDRSLPLKLINGAPTIDPVKHGRWVAWREDLYGNDTVVASLHKCMCSVCGGELDLFLPLRPGQMIAKYCANCGACMDEVSE